MCSFERSKEKQKRPAVVSTQICQAEVKEKRFVWAVIGEGGWIIVSQRKRAGSGGEIVLEMFWPELLSLNLTTFSTHSYIIKNTN